MSVLTNSPLNQAVYTKLKESRLSLGLSMRQLSNKLKKPMLFIAHVESGKRTLSTDELDTYCSALELTASSLDNLKV